MKSELDLPENKVFILFDGVCSFCSNTVNTIIQKDKKDQFRFVALQSEKGEKICTYLGINIKNTDSIILYVPNEAYYVKSQAAFQIAKKLGGVYLFISPLCLIPTSISDIVYDFVAKNRYNWFGKKNQCMIPDAKVREKFL